MNERDHVALMAPSIGPARRGGQPRFLVLRTLGGSRCRRSGRPSVAPRASWRLGPGGGAAAPRRHGLRRHHGAAACRERFCSPPNGLKLSRERRLRPPRRVPRGPAREAPRNTRPPFVGSNFRLGGLPVQVRRSALPPRSTSDLLDDDAACVESEGPEIAGVRREDRSAWVGERNDQGVDC